MGYPAGLRTNARLLTGADGEDLGKADEANEK